MTTDSRRHGGTRAVFCVLLAAFALVAGLPIGVRLSSPVAIPVANSGFRPAYFADVTTPKPPSPPSLPTGRNFFAATAPASGGNTASNQTGATATRTTSPSTPAATPTLSAAARTAVARNAGVGAAAVATTAPTAPTVTARTTITATTARTTTAATATTGASTARAAGTGTATAGATAAVAGNVSGLTGATPTASQVAVATNAPAATVAPTVTAVPVATLPPTAAPISDASDLYAKVGPAVVMISNPAQRNPRSHNDGIASGLIYDAQGYIVTLGRVLVGGRNGELVKQVDVIFSDDRKTTGTVIGRDPVTDLAVVKIDPANIPAVAPFGDANGVRVGQAVIAIGSPMEFSGSVTRGVISGVNRPVGERSGLLQTSAAVSGGTHGGPLVDGTGSVIGVLTLNIHDDATVRLGFAVPGGTAKAVTAALVQGNAASRPSLGATTEMLTPTRAVALGLATNTGAYVSSVFKDGPAEKGGLLPGDVITAINGTPVTNATPLHDAVRPLAPKQSVQFTLNRKGATQQVMVTLGEG